MKQMYLLKIYYRTMGYITSPLGARVYLEHHHSWLSNLGG